MVSLRKGSPVTVHPVRQLPEIGKIKYYFPQLIFSFMMKVLLILYNVLPVVLLKLLQYLATEKMDNPFFLSKQLSFKNVNIRTFMVSLFLRFLVVLYSYKHM